MILRLSISSLTNSKLLRTSYFFSERYLGIVEIPPQIVESDTKVKTTFKLCFPHHSFCNDLRIEPAFVKTEREYIQITYPISWYIWFSLENIYCSKRKKKKVLYVVVRKTWERWCIWHLTSSNDTQTCGFGMNKDDFLFAFQVRHSEFLILEL